VNVLSGSFDCGAIEHASFALTTEIEIKDMVQLYPERPGGIRVVGLGNK